METANLTDEQIAMRYPSSIIEWEMKHGFARYERNGMLYVCAVRPIEEINESIRKENEERARRAQNARKG
jgi:hypothetical protein